MPTELVTRITARTVVAVPIAHAVASSDTKTEKFEQRSQPVNEESFVAVKDQTPIISRVSSSPIQIEQQPKLIDKKPTSRPKDTDVLGKTADKLVTNSSSTTSSSNNVMRALEKSEAEPVEEVAARFDAAYLDNPKPIYPPLSRRMNEQGTVYLLVTITADGNVKKISIQKSSGFDRLDESALATVTHWRFVPAKRGNISIEANVIVPINFKR